MNAQQRQNVINQIDTFKNINLESIFATKLGDQAKPETISAGDYTVIEIFSLSKQVVLQLEERINTPNMWQMLPSFQNFNNDFGNCDLLSQLAKLSTYLSQGNYENSIGALQSLIYYQIINGFWDRPKKIEVGKRLKELELTENRINLVEAHLNNRRTQLEELLSNATQVKGNLDTFVDTETKKFSILTENLSNSNATLEAITKHKTDAETILSNINTLQTECGKIKSAIETIQEEATSKQILIETAYTDFVKKSTATLKESDGKLIEINKDHTYVFEKKEEVRAMMSYISDGTLSHSFNSRKTKIQTSVWVWLGSSILSAILMAIWIYIVFMFLNANTSNAIANIIMSIAKTSPMIVLFWFSLNQYQKERNLLEEYAFREAMALTLNAYLDQLEGEEDSYKRELLINTVEKLYSKPKISSEGVGLFSFKSKDLVELIKEIRGVLIEVKSKK